MNLGRPFLGLAWLAGWWLLLRVPSLPARRGRPVPTGAPTVSVVIPARDEAEALPRLLRSLAGQSRPPVQVIVVDDDSSDATGTVAAEAGAIVLSAPPLPGGWTGKAWACWHGAGAAEGDVLVFLDADTELEPDALAHLTGALEDAGGLVSVQPWHTTVRRHERLSAYFNVVATMGTGMAAARPGSRLVGAFGPCLAVTRAEYLARGGHRAVRAEILDDLALARRFRTVRAYGGRGSVRYRMYPHGLGHLVEGWSKNIASGAGATPPLRRLLVVLWVAGSIVAAWGGLGLAARALAGRPGPITLPVVAYLAYAAQLAVMLGQLGSFGTATAAAFPVPLAVFLAVFARSLHLTGRGRVRWKGREIALRPARPA